LGPPASPALVPRICNGPVTVVRYCVLLVASSLRLFRAALLAQNRDYDTSIDSASLAGHIHFAEGQTKSKHRTIDKVLKALLVAGTACADSPAVAESSAESLRRIRHPKVLPDRRRVRALSGHFVATAIRCLSSAESCAPFAI